MLVLPLPLVRVREELEGGVVVVVVVEVWLLVVGPVVGVVVFLRVPGRSWGVTVAVVLLLRIPAPAGSSDVVFAVVVWLLVRVVGLPRLLLVTP